MKKQSRSLASNHLDFIDDKTAALLLNTPKSARIILWTIVFFFISAVIWASFAQLDQVTVGQGKVIPSSQLQVVQNLEGGIVEKVLIKVGQHVDKGQKLILLDDTLFQSDYQERNLALAAAKADVARLNALHETVHVDKEKAENNWQKSVVISPQAIVFEPEFLHNHPKLVQRQKNHYLDEVSNIENQLSVTSEQISQKERELIENKSRLKNLKDNYAIAKKEYNITKPLADEGIVPPIELLKLERQLNSTQQELNSTSLKIPVLKAAIKEAIYKHIDIALKFRSDVQAELNETSDKLASLSQSQVGLKDRVNRTTVTSPVTGTIQKIYINTVGGVIQPGMPLVEIVPTEDNLLIEAKIAPQDIGFLRPGLQAIVKFSAYDFTRYGGLSGTLENISADTIQDEEGNSFYQVRIRTHKNNLTGPNGDPLPIIPGMTASADIITGKRTVLQYLLKPILTASQTALRE
ncbi:HlyD family type I secretion periplasmic adaptor subunit [Photobacterium aphoticum]|uniref:Membrane fusion protein (MFP) family protein n=1 Tax=Photobacterium aphoticum TaxID=754436 RepID=A0A0J1GRN1_9GAMM|nr:HlyD family type I secretion periplasmic adaptor subunit [Photobacterium aphoticum]KLV02390.1 hemolysin secretion protein D [Photobacterium aphoticum]PSU56179.1 HlyD family type I secretion periplasmic adaptor subunit [Photobacterium aphoticum]GHA46652.1 HlyD family type I secretion periplasmic adaptor subunit [Photobacterium aphoticum]